MEQQMASHKPLSFSQALWQLPRQYLKVLCRPSVQTFREEKGKAHWGIVFFQFYVLVVITVVLSYLAHFIPTSALHSVTALQLGSAQPFKFLPPPYNGMTFILASFFIGLATAYLFSRMWRGQGTFLEHAYCLLLCTVPLVTISGLLLLIPSSGSLVALLIGLVFTLFVYRMVLHGFTIIAVHDLSGGRATLIVLIIPMLIVGLIMLAMLVFLIFTGGEVIGGLLEGFEWIPGGHGTPKRAKPSREDVL